MSIPALFVTHRVHIGDAKGGVQRCTSEFLQVLAAADFKLKVIEIEHDHRFVARVVRQFYSSPYFRPIRRDFLRLIANEAQHCDIIFFNQVALAGGIHDLQRISNISATKVLLSHGCELTDLLHIARLRNTLPLSTRLRPSPSLALAAVLRDEVRARAEVDAVLAISPFDAQLEQWLGVPRVEWLPRTVERSPLSWRPNSNWFGFVGTLDHAPNLEGLVLILDALCRQQLKTIRVRVVGGPTRLGNWLANRFPNVDYLGPLDDTALQAEASHWLAFLNPIFCLARGCSTKLALAIGWEIPIITTDRGRRGYVWQSGALAEASSVDDFVVQMLALQTEDNAQAARKGVIDVAASTPGVQEIAASLKRFLLTV